MKINQDQWKYLLRCLISSFMYESNILEKWSFCNLNLDMEKNVTDINNNNLEENIWLKLGA